MLAAIAFDLNADAASAGWIPTLSFGGLLIGIVLFVPLGDRVDKRTLVLSKIVVMTLAQAIMAAAPSIAVLAAGSLVTGICSSLSQHFISITAEVAHPSHRGRALGTQLTAMFSGILFARIFGGLIATYLGWRYSYMLSACMLLAINRGAVGAVAEHETNDAGILQRLAVVALSAVAIARRDSPRDRNTVHVRDLLWGLLGSRRTHARAAASSGAHCCRADRNTGCRRHTRRAPPQGVAPIA
jgi:MFS family permease